MFNPYPHLRLAGVLCFFISGLTSNISLLLFGFILLAVGTVGGLDLVERRLTLLEKEKRNAKTDTNENLD